MGFNHKDSGYNSVSAFVDDMHISEYHHLMAFVKLLKSRGWDQPLRNKKWAEFARKYNGSDYATNKYDIKLEQAYNAYSVGK